MITLQYGGIYISYFIDSFLKDYIIARYEEDPTRNNQKLRFGTICWFL